MRWSTSPTLTSTTQPHPSPYVLYPLAAGLSLLVPIVSVVVLVRTRWRGAKTYGWMLLIALVAMVGLYPTDGQYPLSQALSWLYEQVRMVAELTGRD